MTDDKIRRNSVKQADPNTPKARLDAETHYRELVSRNIHFVTKEEQAALRSIRVLIAGCGSTGGACIEALTRAGVCHFFLADNGEYELSNLNRQHARLENLGENKAQFHAQELLSINPFAQVEVASDGINLKNVDHFVSSVDFVFDAVDVTTTEGIRAKVLLHQKCHHYGKPVLAGLDLGYLQWGCSYDYRDRTTKVLHGHADAALNSTHPIAALFKLYPVNILPAHACQLVDDLLEGRSDFASQMGCTSDALSAVIVPALIRFASQGHLISGWEVDLSRYRYSLKERISWAVRGPFLRHKLGRKIKTL
jgi:hypothetical protein